MRSGNKILLKCTPETIYGIISLNWERNGKKSFEFFEKIRKEQNHEFHLLKSHFLSTASNRSKLQGQIEKKKKEINPADSRTNPSGSKKNYF